MGKIFGIVGKIFGGILSLVGGLFGIVTGLFGSDKSGYYLELDESGNERTVAQPTTPMSTAAIQSPNPATAVANAPNPDKASSAEAAPAVTQGAHTTQPAGPTVDPLELIQAAIANGSSAGTGPSSNGGVAEQNFATDYLLVPSNSSRRRPGPSLSAFKEMAKGMGRR